MPNFLIRFVTERLYDIHTNDTIWFLVMLVLHFVFGMVFFAIAMESKEPICAGYLTLLGATCCVAGIFFTIIKIYIDSIWDKWTRKYYGHVAYKDALSRQMDSAGKF